MGLPRIIINISKLVHNLRTIQEQCFRAGVRLTGVIKGLAGDFKVAETLVAAGLTELGDSRIENLERFNVLPKIRKVLLRLPSISKLTKVVRYADASLNSEPETMGQLNRMAKRHEIFLMVDLGDRREGVLEAELVQLARFCHGLKNIAVVGIGSNFSCFAGVKPTWDKLKTLVDLADYLKQEFHFPIQYVSGGNTSSLPLLYSGSLPPGINHLRVGEGLLLGRETLTGKPLPDLFQDAFLVEAEVIQARWKPAKPDGQIGRDAFGRKPELVNISDGFKLLLNLGQQDTSVAGLIPLDNDFRVLGGSSDYLVLASKEQVKVGSTVLFLPDYWSLLTLMTSPYVENHYL